MPIASTQPTKQITVKHPSLVRCQGRRCCPRPNCSSIPLRSCKTMWSGLATSSLVGGLDRITGALELTSSLNVLLKSSTCLLYWLCFSTPVQKQASFSIRDQCWGRPAWNGTA